MTIKTFQEAVDTLRMIYRGQCRYLFPYLDWWNKELGGDRLVSSITTEDLDQGIAKLMREPAMRYWRGKGVVAASKNRTAGTVNRYIGVLATLFKLLKTARYLPRSFVSPIVHGTKLPEPPGRTLQVCLDDVHALVTGARLTRNPKLPALIAVACTTGLRKGNLQALRWKEIDLDNGFIDVQITKNGLPVRSVLPPWVVKELLRIKPTLVDKDEVVFGVKAFVKAWQSALKHAGLPEDYTFHHCRHIAASILAQSGASLPTIMQALNHRTPSMAIRYSHLNTKALEQAVQHAWG